MVVFSCLKTSHPSTILLIMLLMICLGAHYQFGILTELSMQKKLLSLLGMLCFFFALYSVYLTFKCRKIRKAKAKYPVQATCVMYDLKKGDSGKGNSGTKYAPVYLFHYKGDRYAVCNHVYESIRRMPTIGKNVELFIDPEEPIFFCTLSGIRKNVMKLLVCSLFFAGFGSGVFYYVAYIF